MDTFILVMNFKLKKAMIPFIFIVIGSLITVSAAYFDYTQKISDKEEELQRERKKNNEYQLIIKKTTDIIDSNKHIIQTQKKVIDQTQKIANLQTELNHKNSRISELQNETLSNLTGGKSFPKLEFNVSDAEADCFIINDTSFPIRNLNIEIQQLIEGHSFPNGNNAYTFNYDLKDIPSHNRQLFFYNKYEYIYPKVIYFLKITWLTGYYNGYIEATSNPLNGKTVVNANANYSKKFKFKNLMKVNEIYAKEGLFLYPSGPRPHGMKRQDEIEHP